MQDFKRLFNRTPVFARYIAARNLRLEHVAFCWSRRFDDVVDLAELTRTTRLFLVRVGVVNRLRDRLAVGDLRLAHFDVDVVRAPQDVDLDVEMQLAHALDQGFARVFVGCDLERRILLHHLVQRDAHFLGAGLVLRRDGNRDYRIREHHRLQRGRIVRIGERVAGTRVLHAEQGDDVAGLRRVEFFARIGVHFDDTADALGLAGERIQDVVAFLQPTRIDARKRQRAVAVVHDLERQRAQRPVRVNHGCAAGFVAFEIDFRLRLDLGRVRQKVNYCIKNILYTFVFKGRSTVGREEVQVDCALANATLEIVNRRLVAFEIGLQQVVVLLDGRFDQLFAPLGNQVRHVFRWIDNVVRVRIGRIFPDPGFLSQQVYDADEVVFDADRQHHDQRDWRPVHP